jgi:tetratricopeptide (TPR) repeat protein
VVRVQPGEGKIKTSILFIILISFFNSLCSAQTHPLAVDCGAATFFADMKGDGGNEKIILTSTSKDNECLYKSLVIYEQDQQVYQTINEGVEYGSGHLGDIKVQPLRKDEKSQIFLDIYHDDAAGSSAKVIEWMDGKYLETLSENNLETAVLQDLEGNGNFQVVLTEYKSNYSDALPDIYDFDPAQKKYIISSKKHLGFFHQLILDDELALKESSEKGSDCCTRTTMWGKIINAALLLGDKEKAKDATERLSDVYVEYGKAYYREKNYPVAIRSYSRAIKTNDGNWIAFGLRGYSYFRMHDVEKAVDSLEQSITINPNYLEGHYNLALAYWASGLKEKALYEVKKVINLDPSFKDKIKEDGQFKSFKHSEEFNELIGS